MHFDLIIRSEIQLALLVRVRQVQGSIRQKLWSIQKSPFFAHPLQQDLAYVCSERNFQYIHVDGVQYFKTEMYVSRPSFGGVGDLWFIRVHFSMYCADFSFRFSVSLDSSEHHIRLAHRDM